MFYQFTNSTTAYADEVMANFYHVGHEDRLPYLDGGALTPVDNTADLGDATYKWRKVFSENFYAQFSITSDFIIRNEESITFTAAASSIEISGLNGDSYDYMISITIIPNAAGSTETCRIIFNGDSATNYGEKYLYFDYSTIDMSTSSGNSSINLTNNFSLTDEGYFIGRITAKTGQPRTIKGISYYNKATSQTSSYVVGIWSNTSDTLTSLKLFKDFKIGSEVSMWRV